jgi:hypothetical protein
MLAAYVNAMLISYVLEALYQSALIVKPVMLESLDTKRLKSRERWEGKKKKYREEMRVSRRWSSKVQRLTIFCSISWREKWRRLYPNSCREEEEEDNRWIRLNLNITEHSHAIQTTRKKTDYNTQREGERRPH